MPLIHGILLFLLLIVTGGIPALRKWPLPWIVALAAYLLLVVLVPPLRRSFRPWSAGKVTPFALGVTVGISVISCVALMVFQRFISADFRPIAAFLPIKVIGVLGTGLLFPFFNAALEEAVFRGTFLDATLPWGRGFAVLVTSILFGIGHMQGYPPGALGAVLAGIYGAALGYLRLISGGLGLPIAAHVVADASIFILLVRADVL